MELVYTTMCICMYVRAYVRMCCCVMCMRTWDCDTVLWKMTFIGCECQQPDVANYFHITYMVSIIHQRMMEYHNITTSSLLGRWEGRVRWMPATQITSQPLCTYVQYTIPQHGLYIRTYMSTLCVWRYLRTYVHVTTVSIHTHIRTYILTYIDNYRRRCVLTLCYVCVVRYHYVGRCVQQLTTKEWCVNWWRLFVSQTSRTATYHPACQLAHMPISKWFYLHTSDYILYPTHCAHCTYKCTMAVLVCWGRWTCPIVTDQETTSLCVRRYRGSVCILVMCQHTVRNTELLYALHLQLWTATKSILLTFVHVGATNLDLHTIFLL